MTNNVIAVPAANSTDAFVHFEKQFGFETDCWDTHEALQQGEQGFVLLDVRSAELYNAGHLPGAVHLPHGKIVGSKRKHGMRIRCL